MKKIPDYLRSPYFILSLVLLGFATALKSAEGFISDDLIVIFLEMCTMRMILYFVLLIPWTAWVRRKLSQISPMGIVRFKGWSGLYRQTMKEVAGEGVLLALATFGFMMLFAHIGNPVKLSEDVYVEALIFAMGSASPLFIVYAKCFIYLWVGLLFFSNLEFIHHFFLKKWEGRFWTFGFGLCIAQGIVFDFITIGEEGSYLMYMLFPGNYLSILTSTSAGSQMPNYIIIVELVIIGLTYLFVRFERIGLFRGLHEN